MAAMSIHLSEMAEIVLDTEVLMTGSHFLGGTIRANYFDLPL
jgi:hypothetical protein